MQSCKTDVSSSTSISDSAAPSADVAKPYNSAWDRLGIWVSGLCALHCMALPLLLPILPFVATSFFAEEWFEHMILALSMVIGFAALFIGFHRYHRQIYPIYALASGGLVYWQKDVFGHEYEPFTIAIGAGLIITAHWLNMRLCKRCKSC